MPEFDPIAYRVYSDWAKRGDRSSKAVYRAINEAARATKAWLDSPPTAEQHPYPGIWQRLAAAIADPSPGEQRLAGAVQHAQSEPAGCYCCSGEALGAHCRHCHERGYCG